MEISPTWACFFNNLLCRAQGAVGFSCRIKRQHSQLEETFYLLIIAFIWQEGKWLN